MMERRKRNRRILIICATVLLSAAASGIVRLPSGHMEQKSDGVSTASQPGSSAEEKPLFTNSLTSAKEPSVSSAAAPGKSKASVPPASVPPLRAELPNYFHVPLANDIQDLIFSECSSKSVPADLVVALIGVESGFNPTRISKTNDYGLMQINICHEDFLRKKLQVTDLLDERQNIKAGVYMLSGIVNRYSDMNQALMVYNCGEAGAKKLWKQGVYSTAYSRKVIETAAELKG